MSAFCRFDRVNVADDVGNRYVGRGEFFDKTIVARYPVNLCFVAVKFDLIFAESAKAAQTDHH